MANAWFWCDWLGYIVALLAAADATTMAYAIYWIIKEIIDSRRRETPFPSPASSCAFQNRGRLHG